MERAEAARATQMTSDGQQAVQYALDLLAHPRSADEDVLLHAERSFSALHHVLFLIYLARKYADRVCLPLPPWLADESAASSLCSGLCAWGYPLRWECEWTPRAAGGWFAQRVLRVGQPGQGGRAQFERTLAACLRSGKRFIVLPLLLTCVRPCSAYCDPHVPCIGLVGVASAEGEAAPVASEEEEEEQREAEEARQMQEEEEEEEGQAPMMLPESPAYCPVGGPSQSPPYSPSSSPPPSPRFDAHTPLAAAAMALALDRALSSDPKDEEAEDDKERQESAQGQQECRLWRLHTRHSAAKPPTHGQRARGPPGTWYAWAPEWASQDASEEDGGKEEEEDEEEEEEEGKHPEALFVPETPPPSPRPWRSGQEEEAAAETAVQQRRRRRRSAREKRRRKRVRRRREGAGQLAPEAAEVFPAARCQQEERHANTLVIDTLTMQVERFEPNGAVIVGDWFSEWTLDMALRRFFATHGLRYVPPRQFCPAMGPQMLQTGEVEALHGALPSHLEGLCRLWVLFWADMRISNPDVPRDVLAARAAEAWRQERREEEEEEEEATQQEKHEAPTEIAEGRRRSHGGLSRARTPLTAFILSYTTFVMEQVYAMALALASDEDAFVLWYDPAAPPFNRDPVGTFVAMFVTCIPPDEVVVMRVGGDGGLRVVQFAPIPGAPPYIVRATGAWTGDQRVDAREIPPHTVGIIVPTALLRWINRYIAEMWSDTMLMQQQQPAPSVLALRQPRLSGSGSETEKQSD